MHYLVYQITNTLNGKDYIGCHKTENKDDGYMGSGKVLKRAIKKYGLENFKKDILFEASSSEEMFTKEKELVVLGPQSYNVKEGGHGGFDHISRSRSTEESQRIGSIGGRKLAERLRVDKELSGRFGLLGSRVGRLYGSVGGQKGCSFRGKHHTEETKKKISVANSKRQAGLGNSNYGKMWITNLITLERKMILKTLEIPEGWYRKSLK